MKVFNCDKTTILEEYDLSLGHIEEDTIHVSAVEGVEEQGHWKVIAEYPETGGKEVEWVVDVAGVQAVPEHDEDVLVYIPYTAEELARMAAEREIAELKQRLAETDYAVIKIAEGAATAEEYADVIEERKRARERINELQKVLDDNADIV